jgi:vitamin B12 transporter
MKTCILRARYSVLSLAVFAVCSASAQIDTRASLGEVVVTANRSESRAEDVLSDITVITRKDIESGTGRSLTELVSRLAGVSMASNGGLGKASNLYVRGTESRHVLLLIDGVRYGSATLGTPNFDAIPIELIDHIEVLKGPASALYGSDAVGGVVQVFTRKGKPGIHPYASITVGEGDRSEIATGLTGGDGRLDYAIGVQSLTEKGFSATNSRAAFGNFNADRDGFSQDSVNLSLDYKLTDSWKVDVKALQSNGVNQFDQSPNAVDVHSDNSTNLLVAGVEGKLTEKWKSRIQASSSADKSKSVASATPSQFNTTQDQLSWTNQIDSPLGLIFAGWDSLREAVDGTTAYTIKDRTTNSLFAGITGDAGDHSWQVNARQDNNSQFGSATTGLLGYGYKIMPELRVRASYGTTFKTPSFNTLYFPGFGNATTEPESGTNREVGVNYTAGSQQFGVTYYSNRIKGFITTQPVVLNVPYARMEGWTLSHEGTAGNWRFHTSLDFLDARNELNNLKLARRPDLQLVSGGNYSAGAWKWGASLLAASESFDNAANTQTLGGYGTVDLYTQYALPKDWSIEGRLVNMGDKFYQTAYGFNQQGRAAYVTLRYLPK